VWATTADQTQLLSPRPDTAFVAPSGTSALTVAIDDSQLLQTMVGFGASFTESSAWLMYNELDAPTRANAMTRLFSPMNGIGLSFLRQPIGASDFSLAHYSYDDMPGGQTDYGMEHFSAARDDAYVFPAVREALRLNPRITVMASPWSAPGWMKTTGSMIGGSLLPIAYAAFASYLVKSVQALETRGVPVAAITLQNEPHYVPGDYPGMWMDAPAQAMLIGEHVVPAFAAAGLRTSILAWDHNWNEPEYPLTVLQDPAAADYVSGAAYHCYVGTPDVMTAFHEAHPSALIWVTECSTGAYGPTSFAASLSDNMRVIIRSVRNWASTFTKWNVALDETAGPHTGGCVDCSALVTVNRANGTFQPTADFYSLGHLSTFVVPGARRIGSTSFASQGLESVAFLNPDGSRVLVIWNGWGARRVSISWRGNALSYDLSAETAVTFVW
jgi:glucosylceramidase